MMITVKMYNEAGKFAENKEIAKTIRTKLIIPNLLFAVCQKYI